MTRLPRNASALLGVASALLLGLAISPPDVLAEDLTPARIFFPLRQGGDLSFGQILTNHENGDSPSSSNSNRSTWRQGTASAIST
jgi:hypothetical protein